LVVTVAEEKYGTNQTSVDRSRHKALTVPRT
jgi:hypothetical protein